MHQHIFGPVLGQLGLPSLVAIPLLILFVLLGVFRHLVDGRRGIQAV
ncbi:hypothetical protein [Nonomuraea guangzhouensis]|uniref:Uncharacterized protein n=1 Tax=Nonomuraea guangzhouensis TaxID=1291555 RepID=A0ABW4GWD7_9ACTN|nr:hypothetical protein [Nonomuraea guangzhouensis]